ncbi:RNA polymerase sigma factor [Maribacter sp. 2308TA10-17]|uniref:RNA polymerase sigma factor n=1 Tax=Maribacter sp. 2308TA10-17 TaxID=3386276 RepID=UPI0039BD8DB2
MNNFSEKSLWHSFVEGDVNAFSTLFKTYYSYLHNYGVKISGNPALTEDCLQSFFVYLYDNRKNLDSVSQIKSYLFVAFRRSLFKYLKKERKLITYETVFENSTNFEFSPEELMIDQEFTKTRIQTLTKLLNGLSTRQREVIYLKYYSDLSTQEISEVMSISYQSVLNTLQKAFTSLRTHIESQEIKQVFQIN